MRNASIAALARDVRLMKIAKTILGEDALAFRATLFEKLPDSNWLVAWHQDTALPLCERRDTPGWGPWSVKDGVNYAHAPASQSARANSSRCESTWMIRRSRTVPCGSYLERRRAAC